MALSQDKARQFGMITSNDLNTLPVAASSTIYQGSAVGESTSSAGNVRALVALDRFRGFCHNDRADNSAGSAAAINVNVISKGVLKNVSVSGASAASDVGRLVYMSDDDTFTLTAGANTLIGKLRRYDVDSGYFDIGFSTELDV